MSDDEQTKREGDGQTASPGPPEEGPGPGPDDALRSLERLEALAGGEQPGAVPPVTTAPRRARPRLAVAPRPGQTWARIAAPVAFLVAVIVVVSVAVQSGVVGGGAKDDAKPAPKVTTSAGGSPKPSASGKPTSTPATAGDTKTYTVKPGDTLSGIAARFDTSVTEIEELNPGVDLTTLQPGEKLIVPRP